MRPQSCGRGEARALLAALPLVVLLVPLGLRFTGSLPVAEPAASVPFLERPDPRHPDCDGRDREFMRFHHMDFLKELRDEVLREGIRGDPRYMLERCRECHTSRERFCDRCHLAVNLTPDCWKCHDYP